MRSILLADDQPPDVKLIQRAPAYMPVIVRTTSSNNGDAESACANGANPCIIKPVDDDRFREMAEHIQRCQTMLNSTPP